MAQASTDPRRHAKLKHVLKLERV